MAGPVICAQTGTRSANLRAQSSSARIGPRRSRRGDTELVGNQPPIHSAAGHASTVSRNSITTCRGGGGSSAAEETESEHGKLAEIGETEDRGELKTGIWIRGEARYYARE